ncbi:MAG: four helix bundle protein [Bacteroidales bacterium]|nr:four helix bundle protein [Bacteroidales bacterium]
MTKLEICAMEDVNPGQVYLYPEGVFYKAYQKSAWILCTKVHPFKVSSRPLKGLDGPLLSVGFPQSSLEKFSVGLVVVENGGGKILFFNGLIDLSSYVQWRNSFAVPSVSQRNEPHFNSLPVYGMSYRLAVEVTEMASRLERNYRYSLGEDIRKGAKSAVLSITLAGKGENRADNIHSALITILDVQLSLRLLNDFKVLPDKRYVYFLESTEDILKQLSNWERSERQHPAGVPSPP